MGSHQKSIGSGFNAESTTADVIANVDLSGRTAIVTGGYSGLGVETVRTLLGAGARVIVPARDVARAEAALQGIAGVEIWLMDLLDPRSIEDFIIRFVNSGDALNILINCAGVMAVPERKLDGRGFEQQFATNHLGHFQLVLGLWPALKRAGHSRVVSVSSWGHRFSPVHFDDVNFERRQYNPWLAYGQSKTANVLFGVELDRRGQEDGIRAFSLHPGSIETNLGRNISKDVLVSGGHYDSGGNRIVDPEKGLKTVEQGASTGVWCATSPQLVGIGGVYCENNEVAPIDDTDPDRKWSVLDATIYKGVMPFAVDPKAAMRLWDLSAEMLEIRSPR